MIAGLHWEPQPDLGRQTWYATGPRGEALIVRRVNLIEGRDISQLPFEGWIDGRLVIEKSHSAVHTMERLANALAVTSPPKAEKEIAA